MPETFTAATSFIYVGILTLLMLVLGARVSVLRMRHRVSMGTGDHADLQRAVRAFGNFTEWLPLILLALIGCEMSGAPDLLIHIVGIALIVSRVAHVVGLQPDRTTIARTLGVLLTWASALTAGGYLVYAALVWGSASSRFFESNCCFTDRSGAVAAHW